MYHIFDAFPREVLERVASMPLKRGDPGEYPATVTDTHGHSVLGACLNALLGRESPDWYSFPSWGEVAQAIGGDEYHISHLAERFERDLDSGKITNLRAAMGLRRPD